MKTRQSSWYAVTDATGRIATYHDEEQRYSFDPWGRRRNALSWEYEGTPTPFLFDRGYTGHEHLDAFELINMNGRVYDPVIARFLSPDPIVQAPFNNQNYNRYSYCFNNPLKYIDPSGYKVNWYDEEGNPFTVTYGPSLGGYRSQNPGSGLHWFDRDRSMFGNFMLMNSSTFMTYYNISESDFEDYVLPFHQQLPTTPILPSKKNGQVGFWINWSRVTKNAKWEGCDSKNNYIEEYEFGSTFIPSSGEGGGAGEIFLRGAKGLGIGMEEFGGTFRMYNSRGFSPKHYEVSKITGRGWGGGGRGVIKTFSSTNWGRGIGYGALGVSLAIGGIDVYYGVKEDGYTYGNNAQLAVGRTTIGISGAYAGAEIGAAIGAWFGGFGAIPGAIIGGVLGGWGGSKLGEAVVINRQ